MDDVLKARIHSADRGICSVCSAHPTVIEAALRFNRDNGRIALIEATSAQVNQDGGYTGMTPIEFRDFVCTIADRVGLDRSRLWLGGDHLGPNPWRDLDADQAMHKARSVVSAFAAAGFTKLHLDTSMALGDDPKALAAETVAERAADLCAVAENNAGEPPVYIIGTEVPPPGGEAERASTIASTITVTDCERVYETIEAHRQAFARRGLDSAFERVVADVVQPGVDFDHSAVTVYDAEAAKPLVTTLERYPGLVFEAHSTDYQPVESLRELVRDGFAILKVGPALTFALREGLFALAAVENEVVSAGQRSNLRAVIDRTMLEKPASWRDYYPPNAPLLRAFSLSDRIRYYWPDPAVQAAVAKLYDNLDNTAVPNGVFSQYCRHELVRLNTSEPSPRQIVLDKIDQELERYAVACTFDH